jgi:hypothetical protein
VTVKDHIYEYTLTNTDNELYCYSNEFHSHLPFDRLWFVFVFVMPNGARLLLKRDTAIQRYSDTGTYLEPERGTVHNFAN